MPVSIKKPAHQEHAINTAGMMAHRGFDGRAHSYAAPRTPDAPPRRAVLQEKIGRRHHGGPDLTPAEWAEYQAIMTAPPGPRPAGMSEVDWDHQNKIHAWNEQTKIDALRRGIAPPPAASPYDTVYSQGMHGSKELGTRYEVDAKRRMAEMAAERAQLELDNARQQARVQQEQQRWALEQMRSNPYGMSIRDLIYGAGGK